MVDSYKEIPETLSNETEAIERTLDLEISKHERNRIESSSISHMECESD
jgi:hypothetical protein